MRFGNKACVAVTLGAAIELKDQVAKPYSSAIRGNLSTIGSSTAEVGRFHSTPESPTREFKPPDSKYLAAEESLRTVLYLSCWENRLSSTAINNPVPPTPSHLLSFGGTALR
ncbi:hypothetical protein GW17_00061525 [Ensete ventricosum]|nr:hypothetical protein GW17_00061525 [Ensete ventricosum]